ncbi:MAG: rod shape-determining protein MreD [Chloroflexi bacterium]|nr:rod shape-determining protein MreD [Chloroflexota bacterium]
MGRYLSIPILGLAAALTAGIVPHVIEFLIALLSAITPVLNNTRGQLNLVMLFVICWSIRAELSESLVWAFVGGVALDLLSILPIGTTSIALIFIAFAVNGVARQLFRIRLIFLIVVTPIATVLLTAYALFALAILGYAYGVPDVTRLVLIPTILFNLLAVIPVYMVVRLIQLRLEGGLQIAPQSLIQGSTARTQE